MKGYIKKQSLMDFCDNTASKTIDNNDIARFPDSPVIEIDCVLAILDEEMIGENASFKGGMIKDRFLELKGERE